MIQMLSIAGFKSGLSIVAYFPAILAFHLEQLYE